MGAHDLDTIADGLDVRAGGGGRHVHSFGSTEEAPDVGEAVYACGHEIRTRAAPGGSPSAARSPRTRRPFCSPSTAFSDVNAAEATGGGGTNWWRC